MKHMYSKVRGSGSNEYTLKNYEGKKKMSRGFQIEIICRAASS